MTIIPEWFPATLITLIRAFRPDPISDFVLSLCNVFGIFSTMDASQKTSPYKSRRQVAKDTCTLVPLIQCLSLMDNIPH